MTLVENFETISPCVVAFISKTRISNNGKPPIAPIIFGTGFLVDKNGIVATNRHVIEFFESIPRHPATNALGVAVILFISGKLPNGNDFHQWAIVDLKGYIVLDQFSSKAPWYGEPVPDIGFVQLMVRETPFVELADADFYIKPGMSIATAGFPMGDDPLTVTEKLNQLTPFLRRGIISSVYPFAIKHPHGFTIDVLQQGGSSGSPVFYESEPSVVGMMASGMFEYLDINRRRLKLEIAQSTNISICVPSATIKLALASFLQEHPLELKSIPTMDEYLRDNKPTGEGIGWDVLGSVLNE